MKVAYIVSRFPKITETFILYEILAIEKQGVQVELFPLLRPRATRIHPEGAPVWQKAVERLTPARGKIVMHPEAEPLVARAHYTPFISWPILKAQFHFLLRKPRTYLAALATVIRANWGSSNYLFGVLAIFPKAVLFAQMMTAQDVEHVHAHFANHPAAAAFIVHRLSGIPYSFTAHGADLQVDQHMLCEKVREAKSVITISKYNIDFIVEKCGEQYREKIHLIHCGIDTQVFTPEVDKVLASKNGRPFQILCIGTLYEVKGHTYLIEACRLLKDRGLNFECHLIGDGPYRADLDRQVSAAGLEGQVHFHGQLPRQEVARFLRQSDVVSVPSIRTNSGRREGIPVVTMEAMASGKAVVASDISGIPELVEDGISGLLIPDRQPQAIADAVQCLYEDPELRDRLGQGGREKVRREFDLFQSAKQLYSIFESEGKR